jgi:hypothetical protein
MPSLLSLKNVCFPRECFLSGNITRVVFLARKPTRLQVEWVSQAKKITCVIFPPKKHTSAVFCLSHATIKSILWHIFSSNRRKFNSEIQDPKFGIDIATTLRRWSNDATLCRKDQWRHFGHFFVSDVILRRFFTKPRLILACDKLHCITGPILIELDHFFTQTYIFLAWAHFFPT